MKKCPFCGEKIIYEYAPCPGCGHAGQGSWIECADEEAENLPKPPEISRGVPNSENADSQPKRTFRDRLVSPAGHLIVFILSVFSWPLGISLGIWLLLSSRAEHKRIGKRALIYTLASLLIYTAYISMMIIFSGHAGHGH